MRNLFQSQIEIHNFHRNEQKTVIYLSCNQTSCSSKSKNLITKQFSIILIIYPELEFISSSESQKALCFFI